MWPFKTKTEIEPEIISPPPSPRKLGRLGVATVTINWNGKTEDHILKIEELELMGEYSRVKVWEVATNVDPDEMNKYAAIVHQSNIQWYKAAE